MLAMFFNILPKAFFAFIVYFDSLFLGYYRFKNIRLGFLKQTNNNLY